MQDQQFTAFLNDISACFINRNFDLWRDRVVFPFSLVTSDGPIILETEERLRENFEFYLQACDAMHLDEIVRRPLSLENCEDGTWIGTYETNLLSHGARATAPYICSALLKDVSDAFKMMSILNARGHHEWTGKHPWPHYWNAI